MKVSHQSEQREVVIGLIQDTWDVPEVPFGGPPADFVELKVEESVVLFSLLSHFEQGKQSILSL